MEWNEPSFGFSTCSGYGYLEDAGFAGSALSLFRLLRENRPSNIMNDTCYISGDIRVNSPQRSLQCTDRFHTVGLHVFPSVNFFGILFWIFLSLCLFQVSWNSSGPNCLFRSSWVLNVIPHKIMWFIPQKAICYGTTKPCPLLTYVKTSFLRGSIFFINLIRFLSDTFDITIANKSLVSHIMRSLPRERYEFYVGCTSSSNDFLEKEHVMSFFSSLNWGFSFGTLDINTLPWTSVSIDRLIHNSVYESNFPVLLELKYNVSYGNSLSS